MSGSSALPLPGGTAELESLLGSFLARQPWAQAELGASARRGLTTELVDLALLSAGRPGLASVVVGANGSRFHVVLGWRSVTEMAGTPVGPGSVVAAGADVVGEVVLYDALEDDELSLELLSVATAGRESARRCRVVHSLASHASLIYDERLFMKCYRVIEPRPRPEIEMMIALDRVGFNHLLAPVGHWARGSGDLALVREFLPGAVEGKALALTSLRDLLARAVTGEDPPPFGTIGLAGGDLGDELRRLGQTTAEMHLALAEAFGLGQSPGAPRIRLHGDYHLRRVMRFESGWLVAGFGDDPLVSDEAGSASLGAEKRGHCLEDVADLFVSLAQVAAEAVSLQPPSTLSHSRQLASGWVAHNSGAFLNGYLTSAGIESLVAMERSEAVSFLLETVPARVAGLGLDFLAQ